LGLKNITKKQHKFKKGTATSNYGTSIWGLGEGLKEREGGGERHGKGGLVSKKNAIAIRWGARGLPKGGSQGNTIDRGGAKACWNEEKLGKAEYGSKIVDECGSREGWGHCRANYGGERWVPYSIEKKKTREQSESSQLKGEEKAIREKTGRAWGAVL